MDHKKGPGKDGQYFNFNKADVIAIVGGQYPQSSTYMISQYRSGKILHDHQQVILWTTPNGGSVGDAHGRYNSHRLAPSPKQWKTGDSFCFDLGI